MLIFSLFIFVCFSSELVISSLWELPGLKFSSPKHVGNWPMTYAFTESPGALSDEGACPWSRICVVFQTELESISMGEKTDFHVE